MKTKRKAKSRILNAVHETASDLHRLGFIDKRKMQKYDVLCLEPVPDYNAKKIRALRKGLHLSQAVRCSTRACRPCASGRSATRNRAARRSNS